MRRQTRYVTAAASVLMGASMLMYIAQKDGGGHYLTDDLNNAVLCLDPEEAAVLLNTACIEEPKNLLRSWRVYDVNVDVEETVVVTRKVSHEKYPPQLRLPVPV